MKQRQQFWGPLMRGTAWNSEVQVTSCLLSVPSTLTLSSGPFLCPVTGSLSLIHSFISQRVSHRLHLIVESFFLTQCFNQNGIDTNLFSWRKYFLDSTLLKQFQDFRKEQTGCIHPVACGRMCAVKESHACSLLQEQRQLECTALEHRLCR